jgi:hypothetical protein
MKNNLELEINKGFIEITNKGSVKKHLLPTAFFYDGIHQATNNKIISWVKNYFQIDNDKFGVKIMKDNNEIVFWTLAVM